MKKTILKITAIATFALLMAFNITTTTNGTNFSMSGLKALASGTSGGIVTCYSSTGYCNWWNSCWDTYKCGPCTSIRTDRTGDRGTCEYNIN